MYRALAWAVLGLHLGFVLWVIFGALFTQGRRVLSALHIASLIYGIIIEAGALPCPLTDLEQWAQAQAGITSYEGDFLVHYLERVVCPDIPYVVLVPAAVAVCVFNLGVYVRRWWRGRER